MHLPEVPADGALRVLVEYVDDWRAAIASASGVLPTAEGVKQASAAERGGRRGGGLLELVAGQANVECAEEGCASRMT